MSARTSIVARCSGIAHLSAGPSPLSVQRTAFGWAWRRGPRDEAKKEKAGSDQEERERTAPGFDGGGHQQPSENGRDSI
jgi:hypothetical protein